VEILSNDTFTIRSSNQAAFIKTSKSGDEMMEAVEILEVLK
jgi:hypothetical protein